MGDSVTVEYRGLTRYEAFTEHRRQFSEIAAGRTAAYAIERQADGRFLVRVTTSPDGRRHE